MITYTKTSVDLNHPEDSLFCSWICLGSAAWAFFLVVGTRTSSWLPFVLCIGVTLALINMPSFLQQRYQALALLMSILVLPFLGGLGGQSFGIVIGLIGAILFLVTSFRASSWRNLLIQVSGFVVGVSSYARESFDFYHGRSVDLAVLGKNLNLDTLFHAALAEMFRLFVVPSIALDGPKSIHYHVGIHLWSSWANDLFGDSLFEFFSISITILLFSLLIRAILICARSFAAWKGILESHSTLAWIFLIVFLVPPIPYFVGVTTGISIGSIGESYMFGLIFGLLLIGCLFSFRTVQNWKVVLFLCLGIFACGFMKVSMFFVLGVPWTWLLMRLPKISRPVRIVGVVMMSVEACAMIEFYRGTSLSKGFQAFHYYLTYVPLDFLVLHFWLEFLPMILLVFFILKEYHFQSWTEFFASWKSRKQVGLEALWVMALVAITPGILIKINSGGAFYFFDILRWIPIPLIFAFLCQIDLKASSWTLKLAQGVFFAAIATSSSSLVAMQMAGSFGQSAAARMRVLGVSCDTRKLIQIFKCLPQVGVMQFFDLHEALARNEQAYLLQMLQNLSKRSQQERQNGLLYVPAETKRFWDALPDRDTAYLIVPAIGRVGMLQGMLDETDNTQVGRYGTYPFHLRTIHDRQSARTYSKGLGFNKSWLLLHGEQVGLEIVNL